MLKIENTIEYKMFDGYDLEQCKNVWRYTRLSEIPLNTYVRKKKEKYCHCGNELVLLVYQYITDGKQSQKMQGKKCPVCGKNYFTERTAFLYPEAYNIEQDMDLVIEKENLKPEIYIRDKTEFLFIDMEWNQKKEKKGLEGRAPTQIGLLGANANFDKTKLFSKNIGLNEADSVEKVFQQVEASFPMFQYIVVWTKDTYDLFVYSAKQAGIKLSKHRVLILQDIIDVIAMPEGKRISFETALTKAEIPYEVQCLHCSKYDVQYLHALYKRMYLEYQELTRNALCVVNEKSRIIHASECRYAKHSKEAEYVSAKELIFKGYRACKCCAREVNLRKIYWTPISRNKKCELWLRKLPLTESNIAHICGYYNMKCNISDHVVFLTTNFGYWRLYFDGEKVNKVFHGNYKMKKSDRKKKKKYNEGFHQQKISSTNFYDVVKYIYYHDKNLYANVNCKNQK